MPILTECYGRCKASKSSSNYDDVSFNHCFSMMVTYFREKYRSLRQLGKFASSRDIADRTGRNISLPVSALGLSAVRFFIRYS
jgi:hypothetical protein